MTEKNPTGRGGTGRGPGRRLLPEDEAYIVATMRMTRAQKAKLEKLGGAAWMRGEIDRAKVPE